MKIKTSWTKLIQASNAGARYLATHPEKTKLEYAIQRTLPRIAKTNDALQELLEAIDIEYAAVDKDTKVLSIIPAAITRDNQHGYSYEPDKRKARNAARNKLLNDPEGVEIEVYFATQIPSDHMPTEECGPIEEKPGRCLCGKPLDISESDLDAFEGIIIRAEDVARIREAREKRLEFESISSVNATEAG